MKRKIDILWIFFRRCKFDKGYISRIPWAGSKYVNRRMKTKPRQTLNKQEKNKGLQFFIINKLSDKNALHGITFQFHYLSNLFPVYLVFFCLFLQWLANISNGWHSKNLFLVLFDLLLPSSTDKCHLPASNKNCASKTPQIQYKTSSPYISLVRTQSKNLKSFKNFNKNYPLSILPFEIIHCQKFQ